MRRMISRQLAASAISLGAGLLLISQSYACATFYPSAGPGYSQVANFCNYKIYVKWRDQGYCSGGCGAFLGPGSRQNITQIQGRYSTSEQRW